MAGVTRARMARTGIGLLAIGLTAAAVFLAVRGGGQPAAPAEVPDPNAGPIRTVIVITVDTLRADRVGAYGWAAARTPAMDALSSRGVRFRRAFATAPITLPSHASLLTGLYPPGHGARHNGMRMSGGPATLASLLRDAGWATGAFVGAFPLDRRFGLDRGFDRYGDRMPRGSDGRLLSERPGRQVVDDALTWVREVGGRRYFLWVHLFEPHAPYEPDSVRGAAGRELPAGTRYDDEVASADREIERLLAGMGARAESALVIVAGDHGEAFGEHGEIAHSVFLYDTTLHVPLVMAGPGIRATPEGHGSDVSLADVFPTVLEALDLPPQDVDGVSLMPLVRGGALEPRELYAETFAPLFDFGWSSLRSVRSGPWKFIAAPDPELYDVASDTAEASNRIERERARARDLAARVAKYSGPELARAAGTEAPVDAESRSRLGALGYVTSGPPAAAGNRPDPKDRRELAARMSQVASGELEGDALGAALEAIIAADPRNGQAQMRLGYALVERGRLREAESHFRKALDASMPTADAHLGLALCFVATGRPKEAALALMEARRLEPGNPVVEANLGSLALDAGDVTMAVAFLGAALQIRSGSAPGAVQSRPRPGAPGTAC